MKKESNRKAFEEWASAPPFEMDVDRNHHNPALSAWPAQYRDYKVQMAWEAWQASWARLTTRAKRCGDP
jgi:hypothetical protein